MKQLKSPTPKTEYAQGKDFRRKLQDLTLTMQHQEIADYLNSSLNLAKHERVEVWQIRNWLYRDFPRPWSLRLLLPAITGKLKANGDSK